MALGAMIGLMLGNDPEGTFIRFMASDKAVVLGTYMTIPGVIAGGLLGSTRIKIPIKNQQSKYVKQKHNLERFKR